MAQTYTSKRTSVNSQKLPAVFRKSCFPSRMIMDYGCGKYTEHIRQYVESLHKSYLEYDPFNQPDSVNAATATIVCNAMVMRVPVDVVCSNVLNVIDDERAIQKIAHHIEQITSATGGTGFITVYEGSRTGIGKQTGRDSWQRNELLKNYLRFFRKAEIQNNVIIIKGV